MIEIIKKNKILAIEVLTLFLLSLVPILWFLPKHLVIGVDSGYSVDFIGYLSQRFYTWLGSQNFGVDMSAEVGIVLYNSIPALIKAIGVPLYDVQKIVFSLWFFLILMSSYLLTRYLYSSKKFWFVRLSAPIIFGFNLHIYSFWLQGEQPILASYVILPLATLILIKFINKELTIIKASILLNIVYFLFSSGGVRGVPLIGPTILTGMLLFLYYFLFVNKNRLKYIKKFILLLLCLFLMFFVINAYFILPFIFSFSHEFDNQVTLAGGVEGAINWAKFISSHASFTNLFRLHGDNNWYDKPYLWSYSYLKNSFLIFFSFIFPILAYSAAIFVKKHKERRVILFFTLLSLVGLFLAKGAHHPFGEIYLSIMRYLPGFAAFRSAYYKFIPVVYLSFSILIPVSVYYLTARLKTSRANLIRIIFIFAVLIYHFPYFQRNFVFNKPFTTMVKVPDYVLNFEDKTKFLNDDRILVFPQTSVRWNIKAFDWGYWGAYPIFPLVSDKNFVQLDAYLFNEGQNKLLDSLYQNFRNKNYNSFYEGARASHIEYILLAKDMFFGYQHAPIENPNKIEEEIINSGIFREIWRDGKWIIYEIKDVGNTGKLSIETSLIKADVRIENINTVFEVNNGKSFVVLDGNNNYINENIDNLPIFSEIHDYKCLSCSITSVESIHAPFTNIIPGSLFYKSKIEADKKRLGKVLDRKLRLDELLGVSLKRIGEIDKLDTNLFKKNTKEWETPIELLISYWEDINNILEKEESYSKQDYKVLSKVHEYVDLLSKSIERIENEETSIEFELKIKNLNIIIEKIIFNIDSILSVYDWNKTFVYELKAKNNNESIEINVEKNSLPTNDNDDLIFPTNYTIEDKAGKATLFINEKIENISQDPSKITLVFNDLPNMLSAFKSKTIRTLSGTQNCLYSEISNFRWDKKYMLKVNSKSSSIGKYAYVKREYTETVTQDAQVKNRKFFNPDFIFSPANAKDSDSYFEFNGEQGDKGLYVYLCTDELYDPSLVFGETLVIQKISPKIYSYESKTDGVNKQQDVVLKYKKIDPTIYRIEASSKDPFILNFSEGYSPNWKLYNDKGEEQKKHFIINGYANGWYIDKQGSYKFFLIFYPQLAFYFGLVISSISISAVLIYLLINFYRKK